MIIPQLTDCLLTLENNIVTLTFNRHDVRNALTSTAIADDIVNTIPVQLQDACSGAQSNLTFRRTNEVMAFPYKFVQQQSVVALCSPSGGF